MRAGATRRPTTPSPTRSRRRKSYSLPKDNIERAIARGAGAGEGDAYEPVTYEGYGPGGAAFVIEALTDNRNRTAANVRAAFNKAGGALGQQGSVAWMFDRNGVIVVDGSADEDELMLAAADAGARGHLATRATSGRSPASRTTSPRCATRWRRPASSCSPPTSR